MKALTTTGLTKLIELIKSALNNKADVDDIPTKTSDLTNDSGFITSSYHDNTKQDVLTAGTGINITNNVISNTQTSAEWGNITGDIEDQTDLKEALDDKANDNTVVHLTGNETISGVKTFSHNGVDNINLIVNNTQSGAAGLIAYGNNGTVIGKMGIDGARRPIFTDARVSNVQSLIRSTRDTQVGSATQPVYINNNGIATACTSYDRLQPLNYSRYSITTYNASNKYIKLASFNISNTTNSDFSNLFWVEVLCASTQKSYALVKLSARWSGTAYVGTNFEILEKYGDDISVFNTLVWAYKYTTASSKGTIAGEIWMQTKATSYVSHYFRPTQCNEYSDYSISPVKTSTTNWTYYDKSGTSTAIASTAITSEYTQVAVVDNSTYTKKQNITDNTLQTIAKTIVGAINEVNAKQEVIQTLNNSLNNIFTNIQGYDESKTQILKNINGVIQWYTEL